MGGDDRADVADADLTVQMREGGLHGGLGRQRVRQAVGVADEGLAGVIRTALCVVLHGLDSAGDGVFLAADLIVGDDAALVVQPHDRADAEHRTDRGGRAGHASAAAVEFELRGVELMVYVLPHGHRPVGDLVHTLSGIAQIGCAVDQQTVAGGRAERIDHGQLPLRVFLPQRLRCKHRILYGRRHTGAERDMQHVALLQKCVKKRLVLKFVQLRCARQLSGVQKAVKLRQRLRITPHVVLIADAVDLIGIEQNGNVTLFAVGIGEINGRLTGKNKAGTHIRNLRESMMYYMIS